MNLESAGKGKVSPSFKLGLLAVLVIACCAVELSRTIGVSALVGIALLAVVFSRVPLRLLCARLLPLLSFAVFALALVLFAPVTEGAPTVELPFWGREVSEYTANFLLSLWVKSALVVVIISAIGQTMSERDLLEGLTGLRLPAKVVALCYLMVRGLHLVGGEARRLVRARDARGKPRGLRAVKVAGAMTQVLMVRLGRRAETQALALVSRGFDGRLALSEWRSLSALQVVALLCCAVILLWVTRV